MQQLPSVFSGANSTIGKIDWIKTASKTDSGYSCANCSTTEINNPDGTRTVIEEKNGEKIERTYDKNDNCIKSINTKFDKNGKATSIQQQEHKYDLLGHRIYTKKENDENADGVLDFRSERWYEHVLDYPTRYYTKTDENADGKVDYTEEIIQRYDLDGNMTSKTKTFDSFIDDSLDEIYYIEFFRDEENEIHGSVHKWDYGADGTINYGEKYEYDKYNKPIRELFDYDGDGEYDRTIWY